DFFFQSEAVIRDRNVTGVQTCALPISILLPLLCLGLFILSSCHTSQKATNSEKEYSFEDMNWSPEKVAWAIAHRQIAYHTLSAQNGRASCRGTVEKRGKRLA